MMRTCFELTGKYDSFEFGSEYSTFLYNLTKHRGHIFYSSVTTLWGDDLTLILPRTSDFTEMRFLTNNDERLDFLSNLFPKE